MFIHNSVHNTDNGDDYVEDLVTLISRLDISDPLHLHSNDSTALTVVSIKLKGTENYQVWFYAMLLALEGKNKTGFIDGSCKRSNIDEVFGRQWDRVNVVVLGWILNSVSEELFLGQILSKRAKHVWEELKETYDKLDGFIMFNLHHKIHTLKQNGSSIDDYYYKLNVLWKQFDAMVELPKCVCNASNSFEKHNQLIKLMQFLMGLDDSYMQIRSSILSREVLPDVISAYATISSEESHGVASGSITGSSQRNQPFAFVSNVPNRNNFQRSNQNFNNGSRPNNLNNNRQGGGSALVCENCGFNGHTIDRCFKIIGYPANFGKKKFGQVFKGKNVSNNNYVGTSSSYGFTDEQMATLIFLIKDNKVGKNVQANMHMTNSDKELDNVYDISHRKIKVAHPNGIEAFISKIGNLKLLMHDWHCKLGHPTDPVLNVLKDNIGIENKSQTEFCEIYQRAKQTKEPFPLSDHSSSKLDSEAHSVTPDVPSELLWYPPSNGVMKTNAGGGISSRSIVAGIGFVMRCCNMLVLVGYAKPARLLPAYEVKPTTDSSLEKLVTSFKEDRLECLYKLTIQTSNYYGSGLTDSNSGILLCLVDLNGDSILQRISATSNDKDNASNVLHFQRGSVNHFTFEGPTIGKLEALWIGLESGQWRPAGVTVICWSRSPSNESQNHEYNIFQYDFMADDILLGDGNDISMVELRPNIITKLSKDNLTLNQPPPSSLWSATNFISNEESMKEYADLKFSLLLYDALLVVTGSTIASFTAGENAAFAFLTGGIGGFLYLLLLQRSVDELPSPVLDRTGGLDQMFDRFKGQVAVLVLALAFAVIVVRIGSGDESLVLTPKDLVLGMMGFLSSKVAVVLAAFKPLPMGTKESR
ncbi:ribonuclease H-like domain-containing protein [Tanacetum coccineum]